MAMAIGSKVFHCCNENHYSDNVMGMLYYYYSNYNVNNDFNPDTVESSNNCNGNCNNDHSSTGKNK